MDEGQNSRFVLLGEVQQQLVESCEDWCRMVRAAREVNGFSSRVLCRSEEG